MSSCFFKYFFLFIAVRLSATCFVARADNDYVFKRYTEKEGLPQQFIYAINQDSRGYLWVATGNGLARFDGSQFVIYNTTDSLSSNFFTSVFKTDGGKMISGDVKGYLTVFNENKVVANKRIKRLNSRINKIKQQGEDIWALSSNEGFLRFRRKTSSNVKTNLLNQFIANDFQTDGEFFIVGTNEGLLLLELHEDSLSFVRDYDQLKYQPVSAIIQSNSKYRFLAGTEETGLWGIQNFNRNTKPVQLIQPEAIDHQPIEVIIEQKDLLWIGTPQKGLFLFTLLDGKYILTGKFNTSNGFLSNLITSGFKDNEGNLWFGTNGDGLIQVKQKQFTLLLPSQIDNLSFLSLCTTSSYGLLTGTSHGIYKVLYDADKNDYVFRRKDFKELNDLKITSLFEDSYGVLWVGTEDSGIFFYDPVVGKIQKLILDPDNRNYRVRLITQDISGNLWFSIAGYGVYKYSKETKKARNYSIKTKFIHNEVYDIFCDSFNRKWFSTYATGLAKLDGESFQFPSRAGFLPSNDINSITEDHNGHIWIATEGNGVFRFDGKSYINFTETHGLYSNFCKKVIIDEENNKWILHRNGTSCIDVTNQNFYANSVSKEVNKFELIENFSAMDSLGNIYTGSSGFLIKIVNPDELFKPVSKVFVDGIRFFFKEKDLSQFVKNSGKETRLVFPYNENHLTFDYQTVTLKFDPSQVQYQFMLEGFDKGWSPTSGKMSATYTNLEPGDYTFIVKVINPINKKDWNIEEVKFSITPPFWKEWWFMASVFVLVSGAIFGWYKYRIRQVKLRNKELEYLVASRTRQIAAQKELISGKNMLLEKAKDDILKINSKLVEANSNLEDKVNARTEELKVILKKLLDSNAELDTFIYHASHDLRGPLARLKGLTMLSEKEADNQIYLHLIDDEIVKMDKILQKLTDAHSIFIQQVSYTEIDTNVLINEILADVSQFEEYKNTEVITNFNESLKVQSDRELLKIILENLIENSVIFQNCVPGNKPLIEINIKSGPSILNIRVLDNGIGIPEMVCDKVYNMYFKGSHRSKGNGLGLYLVKKATEKLLGMVHFESREGHTAFQVFLPLSAPPADETQYPVSATSEPVAQSSST